MDIAQENNIRQKTSYYSGKYALILFDHQLHIEHINQLAQKMTQWELSDAKGKFFTEVIKIADQNNLFNVENIIISTIQQKTTLYFHTGILLMARDGNMTPIASSINSFKNDQGELTGGVIVFWEKKQRF